MGEQVFAIEVGDAVCDALGVDVKKVRAVNIYFEVGKVVRAEVVYMIEKVQADRLVEVLKAYHWKESE